MDKDPCEHRALSCQKTLLSFRSAFLFLDFILRLTSYGFPCKGEPSSTTYGERLDGNSHSKIAERSHDLIINDSFISADYSPCHRKNLSVVLVQNGGSFSTQPYCHPPEQNSTFANFTCDCVFHRWRQWGCQRGVNPY